MKKNKALAVPFVLWAVLFIAVPLAMVVWYGVTVEETPAYVEIAGDNGQTLFQLEDGTVTAERPQKRTAVSFANFRRMLEPTYLKLLLRSLKIALFTTIICLLLGYPINDMTYIKPIYHVIQDIGAYGPKYYTRNLSDEITPDYPATYHWHGVNDTLLKELGYWRQGPQLEAALQANHVKHVYRVFNNAPHVCGIGTGTDAENWLVEATAFWEEQCA